MKKLITLLAGNGRIGRCILIALGGLGVLVTIASHTSVWHVIRTTGGGTPAFSTPGISPPLVVFLILYTLLLAARSVYTILPVLLYVVHALETGIGRELLGHMPLAITGLRPGLYVMLPLSVLLLLLGAIGTIISRSQAVPDTRT